MIEINHVSKFFGEKQVLFDINTCFEEGKVNLIIGRSGSGKTVLMKCLVGLHSPEEGEVLYNGRDFHHMPDSDQRKLRAEMGMVFQGSALFDSMTIQENVMFPLDMFTETPFAEKLDRVNFCLECVEISTNINTTNATKIANAVHILRAMLRLLFFFFPVVFLLIS